ncbi:MAG: hypothetical protein LRY55_06630 [Leadbetterella sp.]|nr:hypothetical protein [Leadbetterella sp.]
MVEIPGGRAFVRTGLPASDELQTRKEIQFLHRLPGRYPVPEFRYGGDPGTGGSAPAGNGAERRFQPGISWKFQSKIQYNAYRPEKLPVSEGWAFIQDVETRIRRMQFKIRLARFSTGSYDSRVYAYENDVLYAVSFPAYYGRGIRWYAIVKAPLGKKADVWVRLAQTRVSDRDSIGQRL